MTRAEYRKSLGLPDMGMDEKVPCPRCGEERGREKPDGCRDYHCPTSAEVDVVCWTAPRGKEQQE